jgi:hypothetical protein
LGVAVGEKQIALVTEVMHYGNLFSLLHLTPEHATKKNKKLIKKMLKISTQTLKILKVCSTPPPYLTYTFTHTFISTRHIYAFAACV